MTLLEETRNNLEKDTYTKQEMAEALVTSRYYAEGMIAMARKDSALALKASTISTKLAIITSFMISAMLWALAGLGVAGASLGFIWATKMIASLIGGNL